MATETTKGYPYPEAADANNVPADLQALAEAVDAAPGVASMTTTARNALAGGDLWAGRVIWNQTTTTLQRYDGAAWLNVEQGAWLSYTPTLAQGASASIAKTVQYAKYAQIGKLVTCQVTLTATAAGTAGSAVTVSVPISATGATSVVGSGLYADYGASTYRTVVRLIDSTKVGLYRTDSTTDSYLGTDPNIAVAPSDVIFVSFTYEAA